MKKRVNKNIPLVGFRQNIERDDATQNSTFEVDASVNTRFGMVEVILPEDPRYMLSKLDESGGGWGGGSRLSFAELLPEDEQNDQYLWTWTFEPDSPGSGVGTLTGTKGPETISVQAIVNAESDLSFGLGPTLTTAIRGSSYTVDLMSSISGGVPPYKIYCLYHSVITSPVLIDNFFFGVVGGLVTIPEVSGLGKCLELPGHLTATSFQWVFDTYGITLIFQDSSLPKKTLIWSGTIPVTVSEPELENRDAFSNIDIGTITVGVPFTYNLSLGGTGLGTKIFRWYGNVIGDTTTYVLPGITLNLTTGVISGTLTSETGTCHALISVEDLYLGASTFDGASLQQYSNLIWKTASFNPPVLEKERNVIESVSVPGWSFETGTYPVTNVTLELPGIKTGTGTPPFTYSIDPFIVSTAIGANYGNNVSITVTDSLGLSDTATWRIEFYPPDGPYLGPILPGIITTSPVIPNGFLPGTRPVSPYSYIPTEPNPPAISSSPTLSATVAVAYSYTPTGTGGVFSAETIPSWLTFSGGVLSGTPAVGDVGNSAVVLKLVGPGGTITQAFNISVATASGADPSFTSTPTTTATAGVPYSYSITTTGTNAPWVITCPICPAPLTLTDNGDGTASLDGTFPLPSPVAAVQLKVVDALANESYQNFNIVVS